MLVTRVRVGSLPDYRRWWSWYSLIPDDSCSRWLCPVWPSGADSVSLLGSQPMPPVKSPYRYRALVYQGRPLVLLVGPLQRWASDATYAHLVWKGDRQWWLSK